MNQVIALLPMKGNSERVPGKNLKDFNGKPLFHHILKALCDSEKISKVIINTDSEVIANSAKSFDKVVIHNRPEEICGDFVSMNDVIEYDVNKSGGIHFLQTHSTNPILRTETIDKGVDQYFKSISKGHDSVFSVTKLQTRLYWKDCSPINHNPQELLRTQDLEPMFEENSNFFIFSNDSFKSAGNKRIGNNPFLVEVDKLEAVDIDEPQDFLLAEAIDKLNLVKK